MCLARAVVASQQYDRSWREWPPSADEMTNRSRITIDTFGLFNPQSMARTLRAEIALVCVAGAGHTHGQQADPAKIAELQGELGVQLGASDTQTAAELSLTGRYLIHVLDADADNGEAAHSQWRNEKLYGLAWAEQSPDTSQGQPSALAANGARV